MKIAIIVAASENDVIGDGKGMIWHLSRDLKRFKSITSGHAVMMGRRTFESIGRPLPHRRNIIITSDKEYAAEGCEVCTSPETALEILERDHCEKVFIIGGGMLYRQFWHRADELYLTRIHACSDANVVIPKVELSEWKEVCRESVPAEGAVPSYSFIDYIRLQVL